MSIRKAFCVVALLAASLVLPAAESAAAPITYTFDTHYLFPGTYSLDFQLVDGDGVVNNTALITNFNFGGGAALGTGFYAPSGGGTGDYATFVTLTDTSFFNSFTWDFTAGVFPYTLSFDLDLTNNFAGITPDQFTFAILDANGLEIPSTDPLSPDIRSKLLVADLVGGGDTPEVGQYELVPEPGTFVLLGLGLVGLGTVARRRRARSLPPAAV